MSWYRTYEPSKLGKVVAVAAMVLTPLLVLVGSVGLPTLIAYRSAAAVTALARHVEAGSGTRREVELVATSMLDKELRPSFTSVSTLSCNTFVTGTSRDGVYPCNGTNNVGGVIAVDVTIANGHVSISSHDEAVHPLPHSRGEVEGVIATTLNAVPAISHQVKQVSCITYVESSSGSFQCIVTLANDRTFTVYGSLVDGKVLVSDKP